MKAIVLGGFCLVAWVSLPVKAQEFKTYDNGLIYSPETMYQLGIIVDSLNLKFRMCDLTREYQTLPQGWATYFHSKGKQNGARAAIQSGISLKDFLASYPRIAVERDVYIVQHQYKDYRNKNYVSYKGLPNGYGTPYDIDLPANRKNIKTSGWVVSDGDEFRALYLHDLTSEPLPQEYARLAQYVDCMVDTTSQIFFPKSEAKVYQQLTAETKASDYVLWTRTYPKEPKSPDWNDDFDEKKWERYLEEQREWDSLRLIWLDGMMDTSPIRQKQLEDAYYESLDLRNSSDEFEFYVARYLGKAEALQLKRGRRVVGACSMDDSPRSHAISICMLAAETANWQVFLRSHLDVMNDRFERRSDGSYAWAARMTYLKELEELGIAASDLLIGSCLRFNEPSPNHYFGSINRVGRALADTAHPDVVQNLLVKAATDDRLDIYNRLLITYALYHFANNLKDDSQKRAAVQAADQVVAAAPAFLQRVINKE